MNEMRIKEAAVFDARYQWEVDGELGAEAVVEIPDSPAGRSRPLLVRFVPEDGVAWVGRFWGGTERGITGVTTWPEPGTACVIVSGVAYNGSVAAPASWKELAPEPTKEVRAFPKHGLIVFGDPWNLYAYGDEGEVWRVRDIAIDGFKVTETDSDALYIEVERDVDDVDLLRVDAATGAVSRADD